ncbi:MAG: TetR/AcrR family transcriptional regulator, partial [Verrucomicrobiota bacterium]
MPGPDKQFDPEEALNAARDVFWERGYEGASLSMLIERMGIGRKSLYDTFGNKRSLFLKVIDHYGQQQISLIRQKLEATGSPVGNLEALVANWAADASEEGSKGCLFGTNIADFDTD